MPTVFGAQSYLHSSILDWSLDFQTMPSVDDPPSSPLRGYDTHTMSAAIPETPLEFAFVDDSFLSEFDLLVEEIEGTEHSEGMYLINVSLSISDKT